MGPIGPIGPGAPTAPAGPVGPAGPVAPGSPAGPCTLGHSGVVVRLAVAVSAAAWSLCLTVQVTESPTGAHTANA